MIQLRYSMMETYYEEAEKFISMIDYDLEYCRRKNGKLCKCV